MNSVLNGKTFEISNNIPKILNIKRHIIPFSKNPHDVYYRFRNKRDIYKIFKNESLYRYMKRIGQYNRSYRLNHPDEAILNEYNRTLVLIEKKCQMVSGSVDEKIGLGHVKLLNFNKMYKNYDITYIYLLNEWYRKPKYRLEQEYYENFSNIHLLFNTDPELKIKLKEIIYQKK